MITAADHSALFLANAVASDNDVAEAVSLPTTFIIAIPVAPSWAALPVSIPVPVPVPPIAAIPIPIYPGLCENIPRETTGEEASGECN
ncbi:hypothetical protein DC522_16585 [Microvirga sp. KLBC 81]|nr:hypothetical protein DC522_16585 [Microvirga sp. KLBC 81]